LLSKNIKIKIYRIVILPVVLYGCETWSLKLSEERTPRLFENRVLGRILSPKRDESRGELTRVHNVELTKYYSLDKIKKNEIGRACGMYGRQENFKQTLVETPDEREHLEDLGMDGSIILK
jgi:hypothetical protein